MKLTQTLGLAALCAASFGAMADELVVTTEKAGSANVAALDYVSSGRATGLEFKLKVPSDAKVNTSKCLSQLPKTHAGVCSFNQVEGYVVGMVFSDANALLPSGVVPIGTISVSAKGANAFEVMHFLAADAGAQRIEATAKVMRAEGTK